ncbi:MAG: hypothetical protein H7Y43_15390, partial [Akkermansiaceae bacterium]|nr:hypothetical protein [Verrucomicrobiales bacterium]
MNPLNVFKQAPADTWRLPSVIALVLANLVPVFGVLFLGWEVFPLLFLFWSENVVIGVFNVLKMLVCQPGSGMNWAAKLFFIPFFSFHYGMFTFVHGIFVVTLFGERSRSGMGFPGGETFWRVMQENHLGWAVLGLAISHGVSFVTNYLRNGEFQRTNPGALMAQPYGRIMVLHIA